ncbi:MAG: cobalt-precorrin-6A reductase [Methyloligellaceae bacterium]
MHRAQRRVLILGGSSEGFVLAERLADEPGVHVISSLAGRTKTRRRPVGEMRLGGFGGADGLKAYLGAEKIAAVIDATHPFARNMTHNAAEAAAAAAVPIVHCWRPEWRRGARDRWIEVDSMVDAAAAIPPGATPAFLTTGRTDLAAFTGRTDLRFLARVIEPIRPEGPDEIWPGELEFIYARGPFRYDEERALLESRNVRCIVTKNSGGAAARAKLDAARDLDLPVVVVRRPPKPAGTHVATAEEAVDWLFATLGDAPGAAAGKPAA